VGVRSGPPRGRRWRKLPSSESRDSNGGTRVHDKVQDNPEIPVNEWYMTNHDLLHMTIMTTPKHISPIRVLRGRSVAIECRCRGS
jgi:hypothetical protein